ncbi:MAG: hypothetical protein HC866_21165 [Leptolyngbyaceae cyanobacterium RU_5_1]|nr:hypothetical protein [Leptolyngbyaceae cyanobacterium RU_5_1]
MNSPDFVYADFTEVLPDSRVIPVDFAQKPHVSSTPDAQGRTLPAHPAQSDAHYSAQQISDRYPTLGKTVSPSNLELSEPAGMTGLNKSALMKRY